MPCTDWAATGHCPRGPQCAFYHGTNEQRIVREATATASEVPQLCDACLVEALSPSAAVTSESMGAAAQNRR